ncbi:MAG: hypothetical protein JWQ04_1749 [Pedosphaera sp.]|nr:hypothetical protein [Pedosphaera sp.]
MITAAMKPKQTKASHLSKAGDAQLRPELPIIAFASADEFSQWLDQHHAGHPGIWMRIYKKAAGRPTVTYAEALDIALCYGWIDGQKQRGDEETFLQKFTSRRARSEWSKINVGHVERLTRAGQMKAAGIAAVEAAKGDGRWERAYSSFSSAEPPADFIQALAKFPKAAAFFNTLSKTNRYAILYRLETAKRPETRARRLVDLVAMLKRGEKFH